MQKQRLPRSCIAGGIALLRRHKITYGDLHITEFDDKFLQEHVQSVSICDTDLVNYEKKVNVLYYCKIFSGI
jgi:hypothetical protein